MTTDTTSIAAIAEASELLDDLRTMTRELLARSWSVDRTLAILDGEGPAWSPDMWSRLRRAGWDDVLVGEAAGGGGGGAAELCVMAEELGRVAVPAPFVPVAVAKAVIGAEAGPDVPAVVLPGPVAQTRGGVTAQHGLVPYADLTTSFLVLLDGVGDEPAIARIPADRDGVALAAVRPLDRMPSAAVTLEGVPVTDDDLLSTGADARTAWTRATTLTTLGWAAELTGIAAGAHELAVAYAKERVAFGRPIGTFQAIKHRLVDQRGDIEVARALLARAAAAVDGGSADADAMVALAAFWAVDALRRTPEGAVQVFGGIGYTWEHPAHVFLRRAAVLTALLGDRATHRDPVVDWLEARAR